MSDKAPTVEELRKSVDEGLLYMEPGTAEACAAKADAWRAGLESVKRQFNVHGNQTGSGEFGVLQSGQDLAQGFVGKARQAVEYLDRQIEIADNMAETFRAAGRAYAEQEAANAAAIEGVQIESQPR